MRQILMNMGGAVVARVPAAGRRSGQRARPRALLPRQRGHRTGAPEGAARAHGRRARAPLRRARPMPASPRTTSRPRGAIPRRPPGASRRSLDRQLAQLKPATTPQTLAPVVTAGDLQWTQANAVKFSAKDGRLEISTDDSAGRLPGDDARIGRARGPGAAHPRRRHRAQRRHRHRHPQRRPPGLARLEDVRRRAASRTT